MSLNRRRFLQSGALTLSAVALSGRLPAVASAAPLDADALRRSLAPDAFRRLAPGSVTPRGWLAGQLRLQLDGLCGRYEERSHFLDFDATGWVHPELEGWEEVPYWLRGYVPLAVATGDKAALANARKWIDAVLATQQSDGFFGPTRLRTSLNAGPDFWPFLPLLMALRTYEEYANDARIVPFITRFMKFMHAQAAGVFRTSWISYRIGDALDIALWLHGRTGDDFLLDLAATMYNQGADWAGALPARTTSTSPRDSASRHSTLRSQATPRSPMPPTAATATCSVPMDSSPVEASPGTRTTGRVSAIHDRGSKPAASWNSWPATNC